MTGEDHVPVEKDRESTDKSRRSQQNSGLAEADDADARAALRKSLLAMTGAADDAPKLSVKTVQNKEKEILAKVQKINQLQKMVASMGKAENQSPELIASIQKI